MNKRNVQLIFKILKKNQIRQEGIRDFFIIPRVKVHKHTKSIYMYIQADLRMVNIFSPLFCENGLQFSEKCMAGPKSTQFLIMFLPV